MFSEDYAASFSLRGRAGFALRERFTIINTAKSAAMAEAQPAGSGTAAALIEGFSKAPGVLTLDKVSLVLTGAIPSAVDRGREG